MSLTSGRQALVKCILLLLICFLGIQIWLLLCCSSPVGPSQVVGRGPTLDPEIKASLAARIIASLIQITRNSFVFNPLLGKHSKGRTFLAIVGLKWCLGAKRRDPKERATLFTVPSFASSLLCSLLWPKKIPLSLVERYFFSWGWRQIN